VLGAAQSGGFHPWRRNRKDTEFALSCGSRGLRARFHRSSRIWTCTSGCLQGRVGVAYRFRVSARRALVEQGGAVRMCSRAKRTGGHMTPKPPARCESDKAWGPAATVSFVALYAIGLVACSQSRPVGDPGDTRAKSDLREVRRGVDSGASGYDLAGVEWSAGDRRVPDAEVLLLCNEPGGFGCLCDSNSNCNSGWCLLHLGERVCTQTCIEECPDGWDCEPATGPDPVYICVSRHPSVCLPCQGSNDCEASGGGKCVSYGPDTGWFCGAGCKETSDCPQQFLCEKVETWEGQTSAQ
jgi:hypothetical protein